MDVGSHAFDVVGVAVDRRFFMCSILMSKWNHIKDILF